MGSSRNTGLGVNSWVTLALFLLVIIFVLRPLKIPLRLNTKQTQRRRSHHRKAVTKRGWHLHINLATAPPLAVLILLLCGATDTTIIKNGLTGSLGIQPYSILILFYSLAYLCVSLDMTGIFQFLAFWVAKRAGNRGRLAFTLFFLLTSIMSGLTSNDVVILTGTAFLAYFTRVSGILPTAFMMSEFTSANIASMALFIGNPTNVIVSTAYSISFLQYSAWMLLPTLGGLVAAYGALRLVFRRQEYIPYHIPAPDDTIDPQSFLIDRHGAFYGITLLVICLLTLIGTSFIHGVEVWMVTLPVGIMSLLRDLWYDIGLRQRNKSQKNTNSSPSSSSLSSSSSSSSSSLSSSSLSMATNGTLTHTGSDIPECVTRLVLPSVDRDAALTAGLDHSLSTMQTKKSDDEESLSDHIQHVTASTQESSEDITTAPRQREYDENDIERIRVCDRYLHQDMEEKKNRKDEGGGDRADKQMTIARKRYWRWVCNRRRNLDQWWAQQCATSVTATVWRRLPWTILPFSLGMFVLVEILSDVGWTGIFAEHCAILTKNYMTATVGMLTLTVILCQFLNNLPATILLTRITQHNSFASHIDDPAVKQAVLLGLIAGSNIAASLSINGSLAGIMFDHILKTKGIHTLGYFQFMKWNALLLPSIMVVISGVLILELYIILII